MKIAAGTLFLGLSLFFYSIGLSSQSSDDAPGGPHKPGLKRFPYSPSAVTPRLRSRSFNLGTAGSSSVSKPPPAKSSSPPDEKPPTGSRLCVLEKIGSVPGGGRVRDKQVKYVEHVAFPSKPQFRIRLSVNGPFRPIEPNESLPAVSLRATGEIIGILDDDNIFHALYELSSEERVHLLKIYPDCGITKTVGKQEAFSYPDCRLRRVM